MSKQPDGVDEIRRFISQFSPGDALENIAQKHAFARVHKYVYSLLIWNEALSQTDKTKVDKYSLIQFQEMLSDLATTQILLLFGMYKPARMMLRSAIENVFRTISHQLGILPPAAKFTHEVISIVRASKIGASDSPVRNDLNQIIDLYAMLCSYAHASSIEKLALRVPLDAVAKFDKEQHEALVSEMLTFAQRANRIIFALHHDNLAAVGHKHRDFVLDCLPRTLKAKLIT